MVVVVGASVATEVVSAIVAVTTTEPSVWGVLETLDELDRSVRLEHATSTIDTTATEARRRTRGLCGRDWEDSVAETGTRRIVQGVGPNLPADRLTEHF